MLARLASLSLVALFAGNTTGCAAAHQLRHAAQLPPDLATDGRQIYVGRVFPLKGEATEPAFIYERRVGARGAALESTHITRDLAGDIAIAESASHGPDYALSEYTLHTDQQGRSGSVRVEGRQVTFHLASEGGAQSRVEEQPGAVVVGPTLVGYIVRHLDALRAGEPVPIRLAVLERLETIGFDLSAVESPPDQTRVKMTPSSFVISLIVDPLYFTFEAATGKLLRLEGRVPPKVLEGERWRDLDARVEYRFVADTYR
jgi:hypothetical protein